MAGTISYSQVGEDLIAAFLLRGSDNLVYIDIGCLWPVRLSNTYYFYRKGGHGLCIDPNPTVAEQYRAERPRDTFVNCGVGASAGELEYHMFPNPVFNTFSAQRAQKVATRPGRELQEIRKMPVRPLAEIMAETGFAGKPIDLMSIDIEGFEAEFLPSVDWKAVGPRLVICETVHAGRSMEDNTVVRFFRETGYELAAFTGHDVFFRRRD